MAATKEKKEKSGKGGSSKAEDTAGALKSTPKSRLKEREKLEIGPKMQEQFNYKSSMQIPRLEKIVVNMGTGNGEKDAKNLENSVRDMTLITAQKPVVTTAKKAIS